jgi:phospholipid/cholesterol/gamma-HCH transport system permease protein
MRVTEQIDAMEVSAINPFKFLVVTRVVATTAMLPMLVFYGAFIGLAGSFIDIYLKDQTNIHVFLQQSFSKVDYLELLSAFTRSVVFGFTIGIIGCYRGYTTTKGTEGVGRAANMSVVISMFVIFIEELIIVRFFNSFNSIQ